MRSVSCSTNSSSPRQCRQNIPPLKCILMALCFLTTGWLPSTVSQSAGCHLSCFLDAMLQQLDHYLPFPTAKEKVCRVCEGFYATASLPYVIHL